MDALGRYFDLLLAGAILTWLAAAAYTAYVIA